ncbi:YciI family protein [uncultured Veillonella sp.]|uniref:YciI family protein n=1 Tax=uncultured Veillonella sp. TaxID=159268 RepID=UPI0025960063|nr:YciI family protein [uncultured Veillonella sp.]
MFLVMIQIDKNKIEDSALEAMLTKHRQWFKSHIDQGNFFLAGRLTETPLAGFVLADSDDEESLKEILQEDIFWKDELATYQVQPCVLGLVSHALKSYL